MPKYLIPPRLNDKYLMAGCTVPELGIVALAFLFGVFLLNLIPMALAAAFYGGSVRFIDGRMNLRGYGKILYGYYARPQQYGLRGGKADA